MMDEHNNKSIYEPNSLIRVLWEYNLEKYTTQMKRLLPLMCMGYVSVTGECESYTRLCVRVCACACSSCIFLMYKSRLLQK